MGAKDSKRNCLSFEDAVKRMTDAEYKRICEAFNRLTNNGSTLSCHSFVQNVLGEGVPIPIADWLFTACGGTSRGISLKDLTCALVLLTKGTQEEKIKFLWNLYCNELGTYIFRNEFQSALQIESSLPNYDASARINLPWDQVILSLFGNSQEKVSFDEFRDWINSNKEATMLSKWLLLNPCVSLSSELETPTFYQTLAGVTHLEELDICELEKCFWALQSNAAAGHLDFMCLKSLICPPIPLKACRGFFLALDVNRDEHIDFKELCCGISAACRGPLVERMKFCFKIFDMDRDCYLSSEEVQRMKQILLFIANQNELSFTPNAFEEQTSNKKLSIGNGEQYKNTTINSDLYLKYNDTLECLEKRLDDKDGLTQEDFLVWTVENNSLIIPLVELLFQVCHVSLGLRPHCRHNEHEIVMGWLKREERQGYRVGQFWYLISSDWWQHWLSYTTAPRTNLDFCNCRSDSRIQTEEGIVCDESLISNSTDYSSVSNDFNSNSLESMGDLFNRGDSCSIASSSGVSSCSGYAFKRHLGRPGLIDNTDLVMESMCKVPTLTGEGGRLKKDTPLVQNRNFELVPDSLWKALSMWYGGPLPLPRQVIHPPGQSELELELYPLNLKIVRHHPHQNARTSSWSSIVGGYGAAALNTAGLTTSVNAGIRRYLAHTAAFSRLSTIQQVTDFLCNRLALKSDDARLWLLREYSTSLLDDDNATLQELGILDGDQVLLEVRNKDLTWPEELGQLVANGGHEVGLNVERRPTICLPAGATGLHNLGNTCFMNAALQAVSNTRPLTLYFTRDSQLSELNCSNPLGTKGAIARRYSELCRELWAGSTRSVAPLKLRYSVTKHAPHFGGGGQHDSQELLAWLLDALHEDLNRVPHKQYIELKDSDGRPDETVAEEAWRQHLARDHSIITDLFYGQLKSKVTCQTCGHESVRFDPFNLLSLPLPMESYILCEILVVRINGECPVKYGMRLSTEAKYLEIKEQLSILCGVPSNRLLLAEVASCQIRNLLSDVVKINPETATELFAYELPNSGNIFYEKTNEEKTDMVMDHKMSIAYNPENRGKQGLDKFQINSIYKKTSISIHPSGFTTSVSSKQQCPPFLTAIHRKCVRQETYFLSQQKSKSSIFGMPLLLGFSEASTCQSLYESVWNQVTRLLSPLPQSDQTNHATDCDDSLGYEFPFTLKAVLQGGQICAICHWTQFCRGCTLPCSETLVLDWCKGNQNGMCISVDWDPTALHLRYQNSREKLWIDHESVAICRKLHTEPIDLDYCLRAFTSEERLEAKYHCSNCQEKQPATKKLQIWRLPPVLIIHLKRFDFVNTKWVKTQKVVNFPFKNFDPTAYLASIPQQTILRHKHLHDVKLKQLEELNDPHKITNVNDSEFNKNVVKNNLLDESTEHCKLLNKPKFDETTVKGRERLISTSLIKTPIMDEHLKDYHQHQLLPGQDPFDLKYQLYAAVCHSGLLNGGHYISYACNPNGHWYCYNDSSCREVLSDNNPLFNKPTLNSKFIAKTPLNKRKNYVREDQENKEKTISLTRNTSNESFTSVRPESVSSMNPGNKSSNNINETGGEKSETLLQECQYISKSFVDINIPKIDMSSAYILFYERSGLDYQPYLPKVTTSNKQVPAEDLEDSDSELKKHLCAVQ